MASNIILCKWETVCTLTRLIVILSCILFQLNFKVSPLVLFDVIYRHESREGLMMNFQTFHLRTCST